MKTERWTLIFPILLITVGSGWLLTTVGVAPGVNWIWTLGLAVVGLMVFVVGGFDKLTFVVGPFLIIASVLSVLRQTGRLHIDLEVPILVIIAGLLALLARARAIPAPKWVVEGPKPEN
jgi:hypothetical protein